MRQSAQAMDISSPPVDVPAIVPDVEDSVLGNVNAVYRRDDSEKIAAAAAREAAMEEAQRRKRAELANGHMAQSRF